MKIYTKTGDLGETSLLGGSRVSKEHAQIEAYGTVDELNAQMGWWLDNLKDKTPSIAQKIGQIQAELFTIGAHLANDGKKEAIKIPAIKVALIEELEKDMDAMNAKIPAMTHFVLPNGHPCVSAAHICRTVCRRAERRVVVLQNIKQRQNIIQFLNRLSDWIFVASRFLSHELKVVESKWIWE